MEAGKARFHLDLGSRDFALNKAIIRKVEKTA
jgi:hypothetical protein